MFQKENKYYEIEAKISLYDSSRGRQSYITDGYRPHLYFGFSEPSNPNYASDCVFKLKGKTKLYPGESAIIRICVLHYSHLEGLLEENVKIKIKEGIRFVGEGVIKKVIGEK
jgi:translation elongation factor EF-Tu-like GTPase